MITRCYWNQLLRIIVVLGFFDVFKKCWTQDNFDITTPIILVHPQSNNVSVIRGDESIELMCLAIGSNVTYSWQRENSLLPNTASGQNTNVLTLLDLRPSDNGNYRCKVSNTHGSAFSNYAYVNVTASMQAMVEPHNLTVEVTTSVSLSCVVNGFQMDNVSYVWEVSETGRGAEASWQQHSATSSNLLLSNVTNSAAYRCIATNSSGTIAISAITYITVVVHPPRIIAHPISRGVELYTSSSGGVNVSFTCGAAGNSSRYQWERLEEALPVNSQGETTDTLILYNVQPEDSGFYRCSVSNNSGTVYSDYAALNITVHPPNITAAYLNQSLYGVGDQAVFVCKGEGFGRLHFKWQRQSGNMSSSAVVDMDTGILIISQLSSSDKGNYRCIINDERNSTVYSEYLQLNVSEGSLVINGNSESMLVRQNSNASFSCVVVDQNVNATFLWSRVNGEPLPSRAHGSDSSVLTIIGVREEDEGEYKCTASTEHETLTATILLTVYDIPAIHQMRSEHATQVSNQLLLTCTAQNDPDSPHPLEMTWHKDDTQLTDGGRYQISSIHGINNVIISILTISRVQKDDAGQYSCRVSPGEASTETTVVVNYIPEIITFQILPSSNVTIGEAVQLLCRVDANPLPSVTVYRNNRAIFTTTRTVVDYEIRQVSADDDGTVFSCGARNSLGTAPQQHVTLTVTGNIPSTATVSPSPSSSITNPSVSSRNILPSVAATSVSATPTSHPAAIPANVRQTSRGPTSIQIRWTASEEHVLFRIRLSCVAPCSSEDVRNFETMDSSLTVHGLKPGQTYTVQIAAVTDDGILSEYSDPLQVSTVPTDDPDSVLFQLRLASETPCNEWKTQLDVVTATIVNEIAEHCTCPLSTMDVFGDTVSCDNTGHVIYRAGIATSTQMDSDELRIILNDWFTETSTLTVNGSVLQVDQSCSLIFSSFDDAACGTTSDMSPDVDSTTDQSVIPLLASIVGGIVVGAVIITIIIVILVVRCRGKTDKIRPGGNTPVNGSLDVQTRPPVRTQTRSARRKTQANEEATYSEVFNNLPPCELQSCPAYQASVYLDHDYADIEDNNDNNNPDHVSAKPAQIESTNVHSHNELEISMSSSSFGRCNGNDYCEPLTLNQRLDGKASRLVEAQMASNECSDYMEPVSHKSASNSTLDHQDTPKSQPSHQQPVPTEYLEPISIKESQEHFQQYDHLSSRTKPTNIYSELN